MAAPSKRKMAKDAEAKSDQGERADSKSNDDGKDRGSQCERDTASEAPQLPSLPVHAPGWLRILLIAVMVGALIFGLFRYGMAILLALRDLFASLFGGLFIARREKRAKEAGLQAMESPPPPRPFSTFVNPFNNGLARKLSPDDLVLYSFEALEAWAFEHHLGRASNETPNEFLGRLGRARSDLQQDAAALVGYFVAIVYGQRGFQAEILPALRGFWRTIELPYVPQRESTTHDRSDDVP